MSELVRPKNRNKEKDKAKKKKKTSTAHENKQNDVLTQFQDTEQATCSASMDVPETSHTIATATESSNIQGNIDNLKETNTNGGLTEIEIPDKEKITADISVPTAIISSEDAGHKETNDTKTFSNILDFTNNTLARSTENELYGSLDKDSSSIVRDNKDNILRERLETECVKDQNKAQKSFAIENDMCTFATAPCVNYETLKVVSSDDNLSATVNEVYRETSTAVQENSEITHDEECLTTINIELQPFTKEQLKNFYYNGEIELVDSFVDQFIANAAKECHEFYELIESYFRSRIALVSTQRKIQELQNLCEESSSDVWAIDKTIITAEGTCKDEIRVREEHSYDSGGFDAEGATQLYSKMSELKTTIHETYQLQAYNSQVSRMRIDNYLSNMFEDPYLKCLTSDDYVSDRRPVDMPQDLIPTLCLLQDCISVLFTFKRRCNTEKQFTFDLDLWLTKLVSALQRVGSLPDSFFLLNHLLRCPPGTVQKMAHFIQFPSFSPNNSITNMALLDHFIVMLGTLALPVRSRMEFLSRYREDLNKERGMGRDMDYQFVDADQDEDENEEDSWSLLSENDLIAIFEQFPFDKLYVHLLNIEVRGDIRQHSPARVTSNSIMQVLAFSTCLVELLGKIFDTYQLFRYRQFVKRISRTIRLIVQVLSDHWTVYKGHRMNVLGDSLTDLPVECSGIPSFSLNRLQVELDQFFLGCVNQMMLSNAAGSIQFLSSMPFDAVSLKAMWSLLWILLKGEQLPDETIEDLTELPDLYLRELAPTDGVYLLTALGNMASNRLSVDEEFITTVCHRMFEISFLEKSSVELYSKQTRKLLASVTEKHAFVISSLLNHCDKLRFNVKESLSVIFQDMVTCMWHPTLNDLNLIRSYLLKFPVTSEENKLARKLLLSMNYGYTSEEPRKLFLDRKLHFSIAVLVVESFAICFPDYAGGIEKLETVGMGVFGQVGKLAVTSYTKIMYSQIYTEFLNWGWDVLLALKLHRNDVVNIEASEPSDFMFLDESEGSWWGTCLKHWKDMEAFDIEIEHDPQLVNVYRSAQSSGVLASYVALTMTKLGHFVDLFIEKGMKYFLILHKAQQYDAILRITSNIIPIFKNCPERLLAVDFGKIFTTLAHIDVDQAGYTERLWQYSVVGPYSQKLAALITSLIRSQRNSEESSLSTINCILLLLFQVDAWYRDHNILYQIDNLCKVAFTLGTGLEHVKGIIYKQYQALIKSSDKRGLLSSVMSWVQSSQNLSLMPTSSPDYCYYAYMVLLAEMQYEEEMGLWRDLETKMLIKQKKTADQAYKEVASSIKAAYIPQLDQLSIYRWGQQAVVTPMEHPFLPLIWQQFFQRFLRKPLQESSTPGRSGIGHRFFSDFTHNAFAKKMKNSLYAASGHHRDTRRNKQRTESTATVSENWSLCEKEHDYTVEMHNTLADLYQSFALWLDEPRLHDPNLFLSALPNTYNPNLLTKIFQGNYNLWFDFIDYGMFQSELESLSSLWHSSIMKQSEGSSSSMDMMVQATAGQRIVSRLGREMQPAPQPCFSTPSSPVPSVSLRMVLKRAELIQDVSQDLERVAQHAKKASSSLANHVALDAEFIEMLPDLYETVSRTLQLSVPCAGKGKGRQHVRCSGPAQVKLEFYELNMNARVSRGLEDNRSELLKLIQSCTQSTPHNLCIGTVHVENIINKMEQHVLDLAPEQRMDLQYNGRRLFYLLVDYIDEDVKRCHPAIQFFSSCIETLGKIFIAGNGEEQVNLVENIYLKESVVTFLTPHFTPQAAYASYVELYSKIISHINLQNATTSFVLLSKYDVTGWLSTNPSLSECKALITLAFIGLNSIGLSPDEELVMVLEHVRGHAMLLLAWNFPCLYGEVLQNLLQGSAAQTISPSLWNDFIIYLGYDLQSHQHPKFEMCTLPSQQVHETIQLLSSYFTAMVQTTLYLDVVYEKWEPYIKQLSKFIVGLFKQWLGMHDLSQQSNFSNESLCGEFWKLIVSVFEPLIIPGSPSKVWTIQRTEQVLCLILSFTEILRAGLKAASSEDGSYCVLLNYLWNYYFQSIIPRVKEEQALELFNGLFTTLPWKYFCPSVQDLGFIIQSYNSCPCAFKFCGLLLSDMDWLGIVSSYTASGNIRVVERLHGQLLSIFVMLAVHREILMSSASKLKELFVRALDFQWDILTVADVQGACSWYAQNVDAESILNRDSFVPTTVQLLKSVCGFSKSNSQEQASQNVEKRGNYIQTLVTLLIRCSDSQSSGDSYSTFIQQLLSSIESVLAYNTETVMEEITTHCSTYLSLLNNISKDSSLVVVRQAVKCHLSETNCSLLVLAFISAASRSLASVQHMVMLLEASISVHFSRLAEDQLTNSWVEVLQAFLAPELNKEDFICEALAQKAVLTLYTYNLHRLSVCQSQNEQFGVMVDCIQWCSEMNFETSDESRVLLIWLQIFDVVRQQVIQYQFSTQFQSLAKYLLHLAYSCHKMGEDKTYSGLLGVIGLGRKSELSTKFRLTAKAIHLFLLAQMPSSLNALRGTPDAPGAIRNGDRRALPTSEAEKSFSSFQSLLRNKNYLEYKEQVEWVISFVADPKVCIVDGCGLVAYLCKRFFIEHKFVAASIS